ncbi:YncE family protein [Paenibacillus qinlingensis]|uniref:YVTN family beta-propeller protein n=1 Tax=Paenibacillus qinlingensis TaxID=1837343 RepID=A0ABU1NUC7_9BACL|nr:YncE family protein [Paenibacillus qinlingensis]MDR6551079.1 YVTN family beta-propeller protein [Paenibacillus qinlingensis]
MLIRKAVRVTTQKIKASLPRLIATIPVSSPAVHFAINPITNRVYFIQGDNHLAVLNTITNKIITTIPIGEMASHLVVNTRTNRIYTSNFFDGTVSVINGRTNRVISTIKVGERCDHIAVNTHTNFIYVSTISLNSKNADVVVINGHTNGVYRRIAFNGRPSQLLVNEWANRIYVTNTTTDSLSVINGLTNKIVSTVKVGRNPVITPVLDRKTQQLYVANNLSRYCSVVDLRTMKVRRIQLGRLQRDITINPLTNRIYISSAQISIKGRLFVVCSKTNKIINTLTVPTFSDVLINPRTNHLFVSASTETGTVPLKVYNGSSLNPLTQLRVGKGSGSLLLNPRTNRMYVGGEKTISVIQD